MAKLLRRVLILLLLGVIGAGIYIYRGLTVRPDIDALRSSEMLTQQTGNAPINVTYLGVSTLLFDDGETAILTDGFFTRPDGRKLFLEKIEPDRALIDAALKRAGINRLAAVIVVHSHYDHAMDAPIVAARTGAKLVGSESTANVGRGLDLPETQISVVATGATMAFGRFRITILPGRHVPSPFTGGEITAPLRPPVRANAYLEGGSFAVLIEHDGRSMLVNASAGFIPGAMKDRSADVVFLGTGQLGKKPDDYKQAYWREVVAASGAKRIVPIHWDDFTQPLGQKLVPLPSLVDDFETTMTFLAGEGAKSGVDIKLPEAWDTFDPFAGLPPATR